MFYKHWQKIALALTGFFWASCDSENVSANNVEGPTEGTSEPAYTQSSEVATSSAAVQSSSSVVPESSSELVRVEPAYGVTIDPTSSSSEVIPSSSSDFSQIVPLYGIEMNKIVCTSPESEATPRCGEGVTCTRTMEEHWKPEYSCSDYEDENGDIISICPDYGVVSILETVYTCDDGKSYNEAQFQKFYEEVTKEEPSDTSFKEVQVLYGTPESFKNMEDQKN